MASQPDRRNRSFTQTATALGALAAPARCTAGLGSAHARAQHACVPRVGGGLLCSAWAVSHVGIRATRSTLICSPLLVLPICALTELSFVRAQAYLGKHLPG